MRKLAISTLLAVLLTSPALAQKIKGWDQWSQKDAQKILDDSPWGRTQTETDTSQMFYSPTTAPGVNGGRSTSNDTSRQNQGATNQAVSLNYRIRFFTAKPIRQAFVRLMEINQPNLPKEMLERLNAFANLHSDEYIIVAVTSDSTDRRYAGPAEQALGSATTAVTKNDTYLERKDGKRVLLSEYVPPGKDGFGARFIFPRSLDGQPFLNPDSGEVRFYSQFAVGSTGLKLNMRFKISDMLYDGQLEY
jgi:hypothetical protein